MAFSGRHVPTSFLPRSVRVLKPLSLLDAGSCCEFRLQQTQKKQLLKLVPILHDRDNTHDLRNSILQVRWEGDLNGGGGKDPHGGPPLGGPLLLR